MSNENAERIIAEVAKKEWTAKAPEKILNNTDRIFSDEHENCIYARYRENNQTRRHSLEVIIKYADGMISQSFYFTPSTFQEKDVNILKDYLFLSKENLKKIYDNLSENVTKLQKENDDTCCNCAEIYANLCQYVVDYESADVFCKEGYGNIKSSTLERVLLSPDVNCSLSRLDVKRKFFDAGYLRVNEGSTGHHYDYMINRGGTPQWFFSFRMPEGVKIDEC